MDRLARRGTAAAFVCAMLAASPALSASKSLDFDKTFGARSEPTRLHYRASYVLRGQAHEVEIWRDGDQRLRRVTDGKIEVFAFRPAGGVEWRMVVLDRSRKLRTDIDRTNLGRIGHFTDWFGLANSLSRPLGPYMLSSMSTPKVSEPSIASCRWFLLTKDGVANAICWSMTARIPLLIADHEGRVQWKVMSFDRAKIPADTFVIEDEGFRRQDANQDVQAD
jgi:hypothetical protein